MTDLRAVSHKKTQRILRTLAFIVSSLVVSLSPLAAQEEQTLARTFTGTVETAPGILPQLGLLFRFPDNLQLRNPEAPTVPEEHISYGRVFPLLGEGAINRGYALPLPIGITVMGVDNTQAQSLDDLSVALGKGADPSAGTDLKDLPFVSLDSVESKTRSKQIKADLWVLPFLNLFATVGQIDGSVNLDVNVQMDDFLQTVSPRCCRPLVPLGTATANFDVDIEAITATLGATAVYGVGYWWGSVNASHTLTASSKNETDIKSTTAGFRLGRRFEFGDGNLVSPYAGATYLDVDTIVNGVYSFDNILPDGDDLKVRYRVRQENTHKYSGLVGINFGLRNGTAIQAEYNRNGGGDERFVLSATYRF